MPTRFNNEKTILNLSVWAGVVIAISEILMSFYTKSQAVLMDSVFDTAEIIVSALFLALLPLIYKPATEKMPYGYTQVESVFMLIKGSMLVVITFNLIKDNINIIIHGGSKVDSVLIGGFELVLGIISIILLRIFRSLNRNLSSPVVESEITSWKIDVYCCLGVSLALLSQKLFDNTSLNWISLYIDQVVAIIIGICMIPQPIKMVLNSLRSIILISPKEDKVNFIKDIIDYEIKGYNYEVTFYDIVQTGRKIWVEIYIKNEERVIRVDQLKEMRQKIKTELLKEIDDIYVELTPDLDL